MLWKKQQCSSTIFCSRNDFWLDWTILCTYFSHCLSWMFSVKLIKLTLDWWNEAMMVMILMTTINDIWMVLIQQGDSTLWKTLNQGPFNIYSRFQQSRLGWIFELIHTLLSHANSVGYQVELERSMEWTRFPGCFASRIFLEAMKQFLLW